MEIKVEKEFCEYCKQTILEEDGLCRNDCKAIMNAMTPDTRQLLDEWRYSFEHWIPIFQCDPVELIVTRDEGGSYEMDCMHVFKLEDGKYATVSEQGCSCYEPFDASIMIHPNKESAIDLFRKWESGFN